MASSSRPLRVLELASSVSAAYAAKLLGDYGADVVKVEPPQGDSARRRGPFPGDVANLEASGTFLALNVNKRGVCVDLDAADGRSGLADLVAWADVLVHGLPRSRCAELGLSPARLANDHPNLVTLSITPFGAVGPCCDYKGSELIVVNAGGWARMCPGTHADPELPPLKPYGHQCAMMAATAGAMAALAMARDASRTGVGEFIDLSEQEYTASVLEGGIPLCSYRGQVLTRWHPRGLIPWGIFQAKDAPIFLVCVEQDQWERLVAFMGDPEWAALELFATPAGRAENQDVVHRFVQEFIAEWRAFDLYHEAQKHRICFAPVMSQADLAANEHLRARAFFATVAHPVAGSVEHMAAPALDETGRPPIRRPAPCLGEHDEEVFAELADASRRTVCEAPRATARLPLEGVRVVDLTWVWAGTFGAMNLAHLGAEVIRFESSLRPDLYRRVAFSAIAGEQSLNRSGMFNQWNQGKKSVAVDLQSERGIELVKEFVRVSDVVMQNFATGVMERLGLGYETLRSLNPRIVLASISGYGQTGPCREYMGYGPAASALAGLSAATGYVGGEAEEVGVSMPDPNAGISAALAVVAALDRRDHTGVGDHLDISLFESSAVFGIEAWMQYAFDGTQPERIGNRDPWMSPHGCFRCLGDDEWVAIACADDDEWQALAGLIDAGLAQDERFCSLAVRKSNEDALEEVVGAWCAGRDRWRVAGELQGLGIAAFPAYSCADILADPHLNARGYVERLPHPECGARAHVGIPWRLRQRRNGVRRPAPCLGADTEALLADVLGYSKAEIAELRERVLR